MVEDIHVVFIQHFVSVSSTHFTSRLAVNASHRINRNRTTAVKRN
uniref:Uncharacterized protein n=1 Tax=Anguilla anguilla TaxID=7936 RepID=A0A0E9VHQ0_ANGAN